MLLKRNAEPSPLSRWCYVAIIADGEQIRGRKTEKQQDKKQKYTILYFFVLSLVDLLFFLRYYMIVTSLNGRYILFQFLIKKIFLEESEEKWLTKK